MGIGIQPILTIVPLVKFVLLLLLVVVVRVMVMLRMVILRRRRLIVQPPAQLRQQQLLAIIMATATVWEAFHSPPTVQGLPSCPHKHHCKQKQAPAIATTTTTIATMPTD